MTAVPPPVLLLLSLCAVASPQPTYDVTERESDVSRCGQTERVLRNLMKDVSQLRRDVAELKAGKQHNTVTG